MATAKKTAKKRGKKKTAKASKIEQALTEAQTAEARAKSRPPLLRLIFTLVELLCMPAPEGDEERVYGKEREQLEERRRSTLMRAVMRSDRFEFGHTAHLTLDDVRTDIEDLLAGGREAYNAKPSPARLDARQLAQQLVDRVFNLKETRLQSLVPGMLKQLEDAAKAKQKAEDEKRQREYDERNRKAREKRQQQEAARRKRAKKPTTSPASKASPAKKSATAKRGHQAAGAAASSPATSKKPARSKAAKAEDAGQLPLGASTPSSSARTVPAARCPEALHGMRCVHAIGHEGDHRDIGGAEW
jgi:hypothetical protein